MLFTVADQKDGNGMMRQTVILAGNAMCLCAAVEGNNAYNPIT